MRTAFPTSMTQVTKTKKRKCLHWTWSGRMRLNETDCVDDAQKDRDRHRAWQVEAAAPTKSNGHREGSARFGVKSADRHRRVGRPMEEQRQVENDRFISESVSESRCFHCCHSTSFPGLLCFTKKLISPPPGQHLKGNSISEVTGVTS